MTEKVILNIRMTVKIIKTFLYFYIRIKHFLKKNMYLQSINIRKAPMKINTI